MWFLSLKLPGHNIACLEPIRVTEKFAYFRILICKQKFLGDIYISLHI